MSSNNKFIVQTHLFIYLSALSGNKPADRRFSPPLIIQMTKKQLSHDQYNKRYKGIFTHAARRHASQCWRVTDLGGVPRRGERDLGGQPLRASASTGGHVSVRATNHVSVSSCWPDRGADTRPRCFRLHDVGDTSLRSIIVRIINRNLPLCNCNLYGISPAS